MKDDRRAAILARIDRWLEEWPDEEPLPEGLDPALAAGEEGAPDLAGLAAAVLACRKDVQVQGKAFKRLEQALGDLPAAAGGAEEALLLQLINLSDRISRCVGEGGRALGSLSRLARLGGATAVLQGVLEGISLVGERLEEVLQGRGVAAMESDDRPFDPDRMVAVARVPAKDGREDGRVRETLRRGYVRGDRVLRPAEVLVAVKERS